MKTDNTTQIFELYPSLKAPIGILSIPHSGEVIPEEFKEYLIEDFTKLSRDVDTGVHELIDIDALNQSGITVIKANIHRIAIDLNRAQSESMLNWKRNSWGENVVIKEPSLEFKTQLELKYHSPYYEMLKALINELSKYYPKASFVDLHSMPSRATEYHLKITPSQNPIRPDFCLSDISGQSCEANFIDTFKNEFDKYYDRVNKNDPYFGGNITREINKIFPTINNIQIEISRALYLDENKRKMISQKVENLKKNLTNILINSFNKLT